MRGDEAGASSNSRIPQEIAADSPGLHTLRVLPTRHWGTWLSALILLAVTVWLIRSLAASPNLDWGVVRNYLTNDRILEGLLNTIKLTVVSMALAIVLGIVIATMRMSTNPVLSAVSWLFVWIFRSVPPLVQIIFWYNLSLVFGTMSLSIPFGGPTLFSEPTNKVIGVYVAAILGLTLNATAYMAEIVRGGILSVDYGQSEAAMTLGLTARQRFSKIVLPQAMRAILPGTGNETINMLKTTSLVSVVALPDLLYSAQLIYAQNYQTVPLLIVAGSWYLVVSSILSVGQHYIERHYGRSVHRRRPPARHFATLNWAWSRVRRGPEGA